MITITLEEKESNQTKLALAAYGEQAAGLGGWETYHLCQAVISKIEIAKVPFEPGDKVVIPDSYKLTKKQSYLNIVISIHPEETRRYIILAKVLRNGQTSQDVTAEVYWPISQANELTKHRNS